MGLFSRKPELQDQALSELGQMFASPDLVADDPTPGSELLDPSRLDFTVESLGFVYNYLDEMRKRKLDENAVHFVIAIQVFDDGEEIEGGHGGRRCEERAGEA